MTTKHVVADDVLGKVSRRIWELIRRVLEGSVNPDRVRALLQLALEDIPKPRDERSNWGTYLLECRWEFDDLHLEVATVALEKSDWPIPFERLLDKATPRAQRDQLLVKLRRVYEAQVPIHGSHRMVRLYRVLSTVYFGHSLTTGDLHFILNPICDFDSKGNPIPCKLEVY